MSEEQVFSQNQKEAFLWITDFLDREHIPYEIAGGLAARLYGSKRSLADIDIDVPEVYFKKIVPFVKEKITYGPAWYTDENWKLLYMTLDYQGQVIDICGAYHDMIFDHNTKKWVDNVETDMIHDELFTLLGKKVFVISKDDLISYKQKIGREVDLEDVKNLTSLE